MKNIIIALLFLFVGSAYSQNTKLFVKDIRDSSITKEYNFNFSYPQIVGMDDKKIQKTVNEDISSTVKSTLDSFKKDMKEYETPKDLSELKSFVDISYESFVLSEDIFSMSFEVFYYYVGAAHPNSYTISKNFDLKSGKLYTLNGLFKKNTDYLKKISEYCIGDLKLQAKMSDFELSEEMLYEGASPKDSNFVNFNFLTRGLLITFDKYQVTPYALGTQYVLIPYRCFYQMADEESIFYKFNW